MIDDVILKKDCANCICLLGLDLQQKYLGIQLSVVPMPSMQVLSRQQNRIEILFSNLGPISVFCNLFSPRISSPHPSLLQLPAELLLAHPAEELPGQGAVHRAQLLH